MAKPTPTFTWDFYKTSDRVLHVDGRATSLRVREWSSGWWYVLDATSPLTTDAGRSGKHGTTLGTRVRRWRAIERAEKAAVAAWLAAQEKHHG